MPDKQPPRKVYVLFYLLRERRDIAKMFGDRVVAAKSDNIIQKWKNHGIFRGIHEMTEEMEALFLESVQCSKLEIDSFVPSSEIDWPVLIAAATKAQSLRERLSVLIRDGSLIKQARVQPCEPASKKNIATCLQICGFMKPHETI